MATELQGVFQTDIILRTAIIQAIRDLRANPQLLDYVFASLPQDSLTANTYGDKEVQRAKEWFMRTEISVHLQPRLDESKVPSISIKLIDSSEVENTLGDIHYQPMEETNSNYWPAITSAFTPAYDPATGTITVPDSVDIILVPGMFIVDANGVAHEILTADGSTLTIEPVTADFTNSVIKGARPGLITELESVVYKETYQIGVHVSSEPVYLTWLHSIVVFALLRYKERFLEARGLERTVFSSSDFDINETVERAEFTFSRYMSMTGYVHHSWPKDSFGRIEAVVPQFIAIDGQAPLAVGTDGQLPVSLAWGSSGTVPAGGDCCDNLPDASTAERGLMTPSQLNQLNATTDVASSARTSAIAASAAAAAAQSTADTALATANAATPSTRAIATTSPLAGGGTLAADLTISAPDAGAGSAGWLNPLISQIHGNAGTTQTFDTVIANTVRSTGILRAYGATGTGATDVAVKVGTSVADGSVNASAKLWSARTGIGGTEVEHFFVRKGGAAYFNELRPLIGAQALVFQYNGISCQVGASQGFGLYPGYFDILHTSNVIVRTIGKGFSVYLQGDTSGSATGVAIRAGTVNASPDARYRLMSFRVGMQTGGETEKSAIMGNGEFEHYVAGAGIVLKSPDGKRWRITVSNAGVLGVAAA